jgi:hypothetical protein
MRFALAVQVGQTCLFAVGPRQPAQEVVEAAAFHHHDDDVVDMRCDGAGSGEEAGVTAQPLSVAADAAPARVRRNSLRWMEMVSPPVPRGGCREPKV